MDVHKAGVCGVLVAPYFFEEDFSAEHLPGFAGERDEQVEFEGGEGDGFFASFDDVAGDVDGDVSDGESFWCDGGTAAEAGADSGDEFFGFEGFGDVVVSTGFEAYDDVNGVAFGGEHDDGDTGFGADGAAYFDAVAAGEHEVEEDEVWSDGPEFFEGEVASGTE